ncbi:MAG TPA: hypothetical protein VKA83_01530 [Methylomirabilota bacterium]|nr:hypothetical protein [Methylomirabilota bacterium]
MRRRRPSLVSRLKAWQVGLAFLIAAGVVGSALLATVSTLERRTGLAAAWMGWATERGVKQELSPLAGRLDRAFQWQLYETARRLQRQVDDLKDRKTPTRADQERLAELTEQLAEVKTEYAALKKKVGAP